MKEFKVLQFLFAFALIIGFSACDSDDGVMPAPGVDSPSVGLVADTTAFAGTRGHSFVVFKEKMWVIGGRSIVGTGNAVNNSVWSSTDGVTWTEAQAVGSFGRFPARENHTVTIFKNKLWVIGGSGRFLNDRFADVWSSADGINWTQEISNAPFAGRRDHASVAFDSKLWVIGGVSGAGGAVKNDVWSSADGRAWTQMSDVTSFGGRFNHTTIEFDDKIWMIGGTGSNLNADLIWSTSDGKTWTQATPNAELTPRQGHTAEVFDGKMWLIGGVGNEVWSSADGTTWAKASTPEFSARLGHATTVFKDKIWLTAGADGEFKNDVWTLVAK